LTSQHAKERDHASQAAARRGFDEKSGERRGDHLKIATQPIACIRKIFAAKLPELMPANHLRATPPHRANASQPPWSGINKPS
jgi:hypothetical protein